MKKTIEDKITDNTYKNMYKSLIKTKDTGKEHGFILCKGDKIYSKEESECIGDLCNIELKDMCNEPKGITRQGNYHTHPYFKEMLSDTDYFDKAFDAYKTIVDGNLYDTGDKIVEVPPNLDKNKFINFLVDNIIFKTAFFDRAQPSYGDLVIEMVKAYNKETEGTVCVAADTNLNYLSCYTANKPKLKKPLLRRAINGFEKHKDGDAPKWINELFIKEYISLEDKIKKGLHNNNSIA